MKPGTEAIIGQLKRQRALTLSREQWADLVDDVVELGKEEFIAQVMPPAPVVPVKTKKVTDPLAEKFERYRKKTGKKAGAFISSLHLRLSAKLPSQPAKGELSSVPKYLAFLRQSLSESEIENGLADVTNEYA